jgi:transcription initiation factor IIF auxiliary subunit
VKERKIMRKEEVDIEAGIEEADMEEVAEGEEEEEVEEEEEEGEMKGMEEIIKNSQKMRIEMNLLSDLLKQREDLMIYMCQLTTTEKPKVLPDPRDPDVVVVAEGETSAVAEADH